MRSIRVRVEIVIILLIYSMTNTCQRIFNSYLIFISLFIWKTYKILICGKEKKEGDVNISNRSRGGLYVFLRLAEGGCILYYCFFQILTSPPPVLIMNGTIERYLIVECKRPIIRTPRAWRGPWTNFLGGPISKNFQEKIS
jgi:hypothetical protein